MPVKMPVTVMVKGHVLSIMVKYWRLHLFLSTGRSCSCENGTASSSSTIECHSVLKNQLLEDDDRGRIWIGPGSAQSEIFLND